jgi:hypothetical protein
VKYARAASISVAFVAAPIAACPRWRCVSIPVSEAIDAAALVVTVLANTARSAPVASDSAARLDASPSRARVRSDSTGFRARTIATGDATGRNGLNAVAIAVTKKSGPFKDGTWLYYSKNISTDKTLLQIRQFCTLVCRLYKLLTFSKY